MVEGTHLSSTILWLAGNRLEKIESNIKLFRKESINDYCLSKNNTVPAFHFRLLAEQTKNQ
jgi:hypothetical protein